MRLKKVTSWFLGTKRSKLILFENKLFYVCLTVNMMRKPFTLGEPTCGNCHMEKDEYENKKVPQKHETSWCYHSIILFHFGRKKHIADLAVILFGKSRHPDSSNVWKLSNTKWHVLKHDEKVKEVRTVLYFYEWSDPKWQLYVREIQYPRNSRDMYFPIHPLQGYNVTFHGFDAEEGEKGGEGLGVLRSFKIKKSLGDERSFSGVIP